MLSFVLFGSRLRGVLGAWWSRWFGCLFFLPVVSLACWGSAWGFARVLPWLVLWVLLLWSAVLLGLSLVGVVALVLSRVCFVRFARPRFRPVSGVSGRWVCVSVSSLPGVRLGRFVWRFVLLWSLAVLGSFRSFGFGCLLRTQTTLQPPRLQHLHRLQHLSRFWQQRDKSPLRPAGFVAGVNPRHFYKYA